jgi:hypothetical protein
MMKNKYLLIFTLLVSGMSFGEPEYYGDPYWKGEKQSSNSDHYGTQNNQSGTIYESRQDKPKKTPQYNAPNCTYDSPCCPRNVDGKINWAYPNCP